MMDRLIVNPIPIPSGFVVKNGLNIMSACPSVIPTPVSSTWIRTLSPSIDERIDSTDLRF